jgi:hypothetical protein
MNKLVIANSGTGQIGKSSSLRAVYKLLKGKGYKLLVEEWQGTDIKAIFEIDGVKVGIESQGDPSTNMEDTMEEFVKAGCDIIVTACRTKWGTYDKVAVYLGKDNGYDVLWAAHYVYQAPGADETRAFLNTRYAQQVYQLIKDRINGVL